MRPGASAHGGRHLTGTLHLSEWACELAGTALLLLGGLSAVALDFGPGSPIARVLPSASARLLLTGMLFAATGSVIAVSPLGRRSGGHINPAVSLAFWLDGKMHHHDLAGYLSAQFAGAIVGVMVWRLLWGPVADGVMEGATLPGPGVSPLAAVGIEALMTGVLVLVIFAFLSRHATMRWTPLGVWVVVSLLVWIGAPLTGTSLNPARGLGPALLAGQVPTLWIYFIGPLLGAVAAALAARRLFGGMRPMTGKLFHDPRYPTIFMGTDKKL
jgi:aquaporin Z